MEIKIISCYDFNNTAPQHDNNNIFYPKKKKRFLSYHIEVYVTTKHCPFQHAKGHSLITIFFKGVRSLMFCGFLHNKIPESRENESPTNMNFSQVVLLGRV